MGETRKADILEAQSRDSTGQLVSSTLLSRLPLVDYQAALLHRELDTQQYKPALALIETLLTELKRLDDKLVLTEVHLLESRVYRGVGNLAKAKVRRTSARMNCLVGSVLTFVLFFQAALTSSRTAANSIYCPPPLQARLDLQSGILHAEDKDYTTAYSYFYETFENLSTQDDPSALGALKYMLLCKVMLNLVRLHSILLVIIRPPNVFLLVA